MLSMTETFPQGLPRVRSFTALMGQIIDAVIYPHLLDVKIWPPGFSQIPPRAGG